MLKITHVESPSAWLVQLEGRLLDPWVPVVQKTIEGIFTSGRDVTFDITCLTFASADGIALLSRLRERGVRFVGCSQLIHFLCAEHDRFSLAVIGPRKL